MAPFATFTATSRLQAKQHSLASSISTMTSKYKHSSFSQQQHRQQFKNKHKDKDPTKNTTPDDATALPLYHVPLSSAWIFAVLGLSVLLSFVLGQAARVCLFPLDFTTLTATVSAAQQSQPIPMTPRLTMRRQRKRKRNSSSSASRRMMVTSDYTSKDFSTGLSQATHSFKPKYSIGSTRVGSISMGKRKPTTHRRINPKSAPYSSRHQQLDQIDIDCDSDSDDSSSSDEEIDRNGDGGSSPPHREQWLASVWNIPSSDLYLEDFVVQSMTAVVGESNVTLLSYHCYARNQNSNKHRRPSRKPRHNHPSVTCAGIAQQGHVALHTWPKQGLLTVDLFSTANKRWNGPRLMEALRAAVDRPLMTTSWAMKHRGPHGNNYHSPYPKDFIAIMPLPVSSRKARGLSFDVYDVVDPATTIVSESAAAPSNNTPERYVYVNGVLQSRQGGQAAHWEALVHPAMLAHELAQRVLIVGGLFVLPALKEVLKYATVQKVSVLVLVEQHDLEWIDVTMSAWNDCSDLVGRAARCIDDPRVEVTYASLPMEWLHSYGQHVQVDEQDPLDVVFVLMDDPHHYLFTNQSSGSGDHKNGMEDLAQAIGSALDVDGGILVVQQGKANALRDANPMMNTDQQRKKFKFIELLANAGFTIRDYGETHGRLGSERNFLIAFREEDDVILGRWFANEAEIQLALHERTVTSHSGHFPLRYFDGATMQSYQFPSKASEYLFCLMHPDEDISHGFEPERHLVPISSLEVKLSTMENAGRGIYVKENAPAGSYFYLDGCVNNMHIPDLTIRVADHFLEHGYKAVWKVVLVYADGYGFTSDSFGERSYDVDPGIATFVNHGCNGTMNVGSLAMASVTENTDVSTYHGRGRSETSYNPAADRRVRTLSCAEDKAMRDIAAGEEILNNYMAFEPLQNLAEYAATLRAECSGQYGLVSTYEKTKNSAITTEDPSSSKKSNATARSPTCEKEHPLSPPPEES